jgi:hypothetical protein
MRNVFGLLFLLCGIMAIIFGVNTEFWTAGCSETVERGADFVFGNACQDRAFGSQLMFILGGVAALAIAIALFRSKAKKG